MGFIQSPLLKISHVMKKNVDFITNPHVGVFVRSHQGTLILGFVVESQKTGVVVFLNVRFLYTRMGVFEWSSGGPYVGVTFYKSIPLSGDTHAFSRGGQNKS